MKMTKNELGLLHSYNDQPAFIDEIDGRKHWFNNGVLERENGPCIVSKDFTMEVKNNFPIVGLKLLSFKIKKNDLIVCINEENEIHSYQDNESIIFNNTIKIWMKNNLFHRESLNDALSYMVYGNELNLLNYNKDKIANDFRELLNSLLYVSKIYNKINVGLENINRYVRETLSNTDKNVYIFGEKIQKNKDFTYKNTDNLFFILNDKFTNGKNLLFMNLKLLDKENLNSIVFETKLTALNGYAHNIEFTHKTKNLNFLINKNKILFRHIDDNGNIFEFNIQTIALDTDMLLKNIQKNLKDLNYKLDDKNIFEFLILTLNSLFEMKQLYSINFKFDNKDINISSKKPICFDKQDQIKFIKDFFSKKELNNSTNLEFIKFLKKTSDFNIYSNKYIDFISVLLSKNNSKKISLIVEKFPELITEIFDNNNIKSNKDYQIQKKNNAIRYKIYNVLKELNSPILQNIDYKPIEIEENKEEALEEKTKQAISTQNSKGELHSFLDNPALIDEYGNSFWYKNGLLHRDKNLPAIITKDNISFWIENGKIVENKYVKQSNIIGDRLIKKNFLLKPSDKTFSDDCLAIEYNNKDLNKLLTNNYVFFKEVSTKIDGFEEVYFFHYNENKKLHLNGKPALQLYINNELVEEKYFSNGILHNDKGPANILYKDSKTIKEKYYIDGIYKKTFKEEKHNLKR
jgi:hypothetical protein